MPSLAPDILRRLEAGADPRRAAFGASYHPSNARILGLSAPAIEEVSKGLTRTLRPWPAAEVLGLARELLGAGVFEARQVAYQIVAAHKGARAALDRPTLEALGLGMDNWVSVDTFASLLVGEALRAGRLGAADLLDWARSADRWWRRAALVGTTGWNKRSHGGRGDVAGTLAVCAALLADRDDMVVKALSWALRDLVHWDADAVRAFLEEHEEVLAARVRREVGNKLETGLKSG